VSQLPNAKRTQTQTYNQQKYAVNKGNLSKSYKYIQI